MQKVTLMQYQPKILCKVKATIKMVGNMLTKPVDKVDKSVNNLVLLHKTC